jgi:hypothetical protein
MTASRRGRGDFALQIFGQSTRESNCDCDRSDQANLLQAIFLQNDTDVHAALHQRGGWLHETTAGWPGAGSGEADSRAGNARQQQRGGEQLRAAQERMKQQFETRIRALLAMPKSRQERIRPRLEKEIEQANTRRAQYGVSPLNLDEMIDQLRSKNDSKQVASTDADRPTLDSQRQTAEQQSPAVDQAAIEQAIHAAYLRTLSRGPNADELDAAVSYIDEASDPVTGLRSVMWALLNTKEFVLSH